MTVPTPDLQSMATQLAEARSVCGPAGRVRSVTVLVAALVACVVWGAGARGAGWSPEEFIYSPEDIRAMCARFKQEAEDGRMHGLLKRADRWMKEITPDYLETMLPAKTPLGETWFYTGCPACGKSHAIHWSGHRARGHLECQFCKTVFPNDKFPESSTYNANGRTYCYHPGKNNRVHHFSAFTRYKRVRWTMSSNRPHQYLAIGWLLTGDRKYARKAADFLLRYARVYKGWFLHDNGGLVLPPSEQADPRAWIPKVATLKEMRSRTGYWTRTRWKLDSTFLTEVAFAYGAIRTSGVLSDAEHKELLDLARNTVEWNLLPHFYYKSNAFSNLHGYFYNTMIMTGRAFGRDLVCKDVIFGAFTLNGVDLIHEAYDGPKGAVYACENLVDREGCYVEGSLAYYQMIVGSLMGSLIRVKGYTDPPGYNPSPKVAAYYKGRRTIEPGRNIDLKRLFAYYHTVTSGGEFPAINDSIVGLKPRAKIFFTSYLATGDEDARTTLMALTPEGNPRYSGYGMHYIPTLRDHLSDAIWTDKTKTHFPLFSGVKSCLGLGVLRGKGRTDLYMNWDGKNTSHVQYEQLALVFFADSHEALLDFGYRGSGSGLRSLWLNRTIAHNTVTVDQGLQINRQRGELERYCDFGNVRIVQASDPAAFPGLKQFRRTVALVDVGNDSAYALDLFEVEGGRTHDQTWVANGPLLALTGAELVPRKGTLLGEDTKYGDFRAVGKSRTGKFGNGYGYIDQLAIGTCTAEGWAAEWQLEKSPFKLRVLGAASAGDTLIRGQCPHERDRKGERGKKGRIVIARRRAKAGAELSSIFGAVFEAYDKQPNTMSVRRLPSGRGIEATLRSGQERCDSLQVDENGAITYLSREAGILRELVLIGRNRWQELGWEVAVRGPATRAGVVLRVGGGDSSLLLDGPLAPGKAMAGQLICLTAKSGTSSHFTIARVERAGIHSRVFVDPNAGGFVANSGLIDELVNPRTFISGTYFRHGNWGEMHKGDVVLIGDGAFTIAKVDYLGWKQRNRVRVTLDSDAFNDQRGPGGRFIVSAAAPGDRWAMQPILRIRRLNDSTYSVTCPTGVSVDPPPGIKLSSE